MYDQVASLLESLSPLVRPALMILGGIAIGLGMFIVLIIEQAHLRISDEFVRTLLYALLLVPLLFAPTAAVFRGGWWWLVPPLTLVLVSLVMRVDNADPRPGWLHPW